MSDTIRKPLDVVRFLSAYRYRWIVPLVVLTALAAGYAQVRKPSWQASQALVVRNEAAAVDGQAVGKFAAVEDMKTVQETILELTKSRGVLTAALKEVGPADCEPRSVWPSAADVSKLQAAVALVAPNGAAFGTTEVFYLNVKHQDPQQAEALVAAISYQLQARFGQMRDAKAQSILDEVAKTVVLSQHDLDAATERLGSFERQIGSDLTELRILHTSPSGSSNLRQTLIQVETELRSARAADQASRQLLQLLQGAKDDSTHLLATPNRLLESQPALRRLKDGLVDAQLRTAQLRGTMADAHPQVQSALDSEQQVRDRLHDEITLAIRGLEVEQRLSAQRIETLSARLANSKTRLADLAGERAEYANLVSEVEHSSRLHQEAQSTLANARAAQARASSASLISPLDGPQVGDSPLGPSPSSIVLLGLAGGLMCGFGFLFLTVQPSRPAPQAAAGDGASHIAPAPQPAATPDVQPAGSLSFKQALKKLAATGPSLN
ncbi:MAG: hypothetical protein IIA67_06660 [Planctomycetes bacterium]|nr:hypothetical protein [Planctomycetota bacterium]